MMNSILRILVCSLIFIQTANAQNAKRPDPQPAPDTYESFKLGIAGYTFAKFDLDKTLETLKRTDVHYLCIKNFHLPLKSTDAEIEAFHAKLKEADVTGYAVGPLYMKTKEEVDQVFEYARRVGVNTIVGVPTYDLLHYVSDKVKEYDLKYAIHLHGPDIDKFPDADDVWENVKDLDPRMGMCLDIGHDRRNGKDPVADLQKYHTRVFDIHLKDVTGASKQGYSVEVGRGILDIPAFVKMLRKVNYTGVVSLEHERNMDNPFMGIAESIGYFRGVVAATKSNTQSLMSELDSNAPINKLTDAEADAGWLLLFDGKSLNGWHGFKQDVAPDCWRAEDDALKIINEGGAESAEGILTDKKYKAFALSLDFQMSEGCNSGIIYHVSENSKYTYAYETGTEYQIIDHANWPDPLEGWQICGANYAMHAPKVDVSKPVGEWNTMMLVVDGNSVTHVLNGEVVVEFEKYSDKWIALRNSGKWSDYPDYGILDNGSICLQNHGTKVSFRNIKIKEL